MRKQINELIDIGIKRQLIEIKNNRIKYIIQNKEYDFSDPEEHVRAACFVELVEQYKYSPYKIDFEKEVPRRNPSDKADIVVYFDDDKKINYIVIENKKENISNSEFNQAIEQGFGNANSLRSKYLIVDNFSRRICYDIQNFPPNERNKNIINDIPVNYGNVPTYKYIKGSEYDIKNVSFHTLSKKFESCHNIIWSGGKLDPATAFDEMSKILFAKIQDERNTHNGKAYLFQCGKNENEVIVAHRIIDLYNKARKIDPYVFVEQIKIPDVKIYDIVKELEGISLTESDIDAKGQAFENFLGVIFRGGLGQYFTRRQIVEFAVELLDPNENDIILDPSCGSGGFLLYSIKHVIKKINKYYKGNSLLITRKILDFTRQRVFGIEINDKIARVAMMDMIVNDDGHTNIENNTGLNSTFNNPNIQFGKFSLILSNPPFGVKIKKEDRETLGNNTFNNFIFASNRKKQLSDILFLEQYYKFLTNDQDTNPRIGVVLQTGVLNNPSNKKLLEWIKLNFQILAVISLPDFAFRKAGSGMKTCLLFLKKYYVPYTDISTIPDYEIFFAIANHIGYDSTLRPDKNDLPNILNHFFNKTENKEDGIFWKTLSSLEYRLDPKYYYFKYLINKELESLEQLGHKIVPLSKLIAKMCAGKSPEGGVTRSTGEIPSITISNITKDGTLDFSEELNFVPYSFYDEFKSKKGGLELYDIIIAKDGATTGKTSIINEDFPFIERTSKGLEIKSIFSEHIFRIRLKKGVNPMYIHAFLNSELGQLQLNTIITGGAQGGITFEFINNIFIPMLGIKDQNRAEILWSEGMKRSQLLKEKFEEIIKYNKQKFINLIKNSQPISDVEIQRILDLDEDIEEEDFEEELD